MDLPMQLTDTERRVIGWVSNYLLAGAAGGARQTLFAGLRTVSAASLEREPAAQTASKIAPSIWGVS